MQKAQQSWHSMWYTSAIISTCSTSIVVLQGTDFQALHQYLEKLDTALASHLLLGRIASQPFFITHVCHLSYHYFTCQGLANRQQNLSSSTAAVFWLHSMLVTIIKATCLTTNSWLQLPQSLRRSLNGFLKGGCLASTRGTSVSLAHLGRFSTSTMELDYNLGLAKNSNLQGYKLTKRKRKVFITLKVF